MKNKDKNNAVPVESIALLKAVHEQLIKILSTLANRNFEQRDYQLNSLYQTLTATSDKILFDGSDYFKEYGIRPPAIPENLIGDIKDLDILWEDKISSETYEFLGKILLG